MNYLDSNIFIYPILQAQSVAKAARCKDILRKVVTGEMVAATSFLTWDEIVYALKKCLGKELAFNEGEKFLLFPNLKFLKVDETIMHEAQHFMEEYNLNPRDAIHAASAIVHKAKRILTDDPDFDRVHELKRIKIEQ